MSGWRNVHIGFESDDVIVGGLAVWKHEWRRLAEPPAQLPHPAYPHQIHSYDIYEIGDKTEAVRFAVTELSNGVWGFYVPDTRR